MYSVIRVTHLLLDLFFFAALLLFFFLLLHLVLLFSTFSSSSFTLIKIFLKAYSFTYRLYHHCLHQNMSIGEGSNSAANFTSTTSNSSSSKPSASSTAGAGSRSVAAAMAPKQQGKAGKRPGRKPSKINERDKLERSRQSARECRARKKLRYQYLEELVINREKAVFALRDELKQVSSQCIDSG